MRVVLVTVMLAACVQEAPTGPMPVDDPDGLLFFSSPWPADERLGADGRLDITDFPNPYAVAILDSYLAKGAETTGFGTNSPIYVLFEGALDPLTLPTPADSTALDSSLILVNIDPDSIAWGERVPVQWEQNKFDNSVYMPEHLLAVAPAFGFPLRPLTTYALVVTTAAAAPHPDSDPDANPDLRAVLPSLALNPQDVAIFTTFTTSDPTAEMRAIAAQIQHQMAPADLDAESLDHLHDHTNYTAWRTRYRSPVYTDGVAPYLIEGGGFVLDEHGEPQVVSWDELRMAVCTPVGDAPAEGWPVVVYQHGTGGHYRGFCNSSSTLEVMHRLGVEGIIGLGIDQPLHGSRAGAQTASDLAHFNIVNPDSGVTNFRQGAADALYLTHSLASREYTFRAPDGRRFTTDPDRVMFMGHSQGGLTGAIAAPWMGNDVQATVLSGAGGVLAITIVERKDPLDFAALVRSLIQMSEGEPLTPLHPVVGIIQTLAEPTDPANYAPYWHAVRGDWAGHKPAPVLVTSGTVDAATPYRSAIAMAAAGRVPFVGTPATSADELALRGLEPHALPQLDNVVSFDGSVITSGFHQWWDETHFVVFELQEASDLYVNYLSSTAAGRPALWREEAVDP